MPLTPLQRILLYPIGWLYGLLVRLRIALYRRGVLSTRKVGTPVLSVGNLTVGGSGKTPVTEALSRMARDHGLNPVILTRGYGREKSGELTRIRWADHPPGDPALSPRMLGDEPFLLARRNPDIPLYIFPERHRAALRAESEDQPGVMIMDDGFQHLRLGRELNLLLVDAERGFGNGRLFPYGPLREPLAEMKRADAILITKANLGDGPALAESLRGRWGFDRPVFLAEYHPGALRRLDGGSVLKPQALAGRNLALISAIAQPEGFARMVTRLGATVDQQWRFPDHHDYDRNSLIAVEQAMAEQGGDEPAFLTTDKDAVKLERVLTHPERMWVLEMEIQLEPAAVAFLNEAFANFKRGRS